MVIPPGGDGISTIGCGELASLVLIIVFFFIQASDRFNINSQLEHLQAKYVGTGHADLSRL